MENVQKKKGGLLREIFVGLFITVVGGVILYFLFDYKNDENKPAPSEISTRRAEAGQGRERDNGMDISLINGDWNTRDGNKDMIVSFNLETNKYIMNGLSSSFILEQDSATGDTYLILNGDNAPWKIESLSKSLMILKANNTPKYFHRHEG